MSLPEMFENVGSNIKAIVENKEISSALADTIKENKQIFLIGGLGLAALYILKDKEINLEVKDGDRQIKFETK